MVSNNLIVSFLFFICVCLAEARKPIVQTKLGLIQGKQNRYKGKLYEEYLGIPFAQPPVRWEKPEPVKPWSPATLDATKFSPHCTHFLSVVYPFIGIGKETSEDCLYLNIWVPGGVEEIKLKKLPVMFWVYGGAYLIGTGEMYPGEALALYGDVIVVNFNYRLSTLGWLSTGDSAISGNYGLWDTKMALEWVYNYIESFGGDPKKITVFGQSAGSAISSHVLINPNTNKFVKNVITMSGASSGYFGLAKYPLKLAVLLANAFNCSANSTNDIEICLRKIDDKTLDFWGATIQKKYENENPTLVPVVDGDLIKKLPQQSFKDGDGKHINFMSGFLKHDAAGFILKNPISFPKVRKNHSATSNESLWKHMRQWYGFLANTDEILNKIIKEYPDMNTTNSTERAIAATTAFTDAWFASSSNWEIGRHRSFNQGSSYQYMFTHRQSFLVNYPDWVTASHMDDVYSVFGPPFMSLYRKLYLKNDFKGSDFNVSDNEMSYFCNFAHTGDPNKGAKIVPMQWSQYNDKDKNYLKLSEKPSIESFLTNNKYKKFEFHIDLPNHYVYPKEPSFKDPNIMYKLSEEEIEQSAELMRQYLISNINDDDIIQSIDKMIEEFKNKRQQFINKN